MAMAGPGLAEKTTPATETNSAVPAVPRAIPDLIPYHKFDPPSSTLFDISKLTISGDLRVRPGIPDELEIREALLSRWRSEIDQKSNSFFVQQWVRLGFNYAISPDVTFFFQPQYSKNWGVNNVGTDANGTGGTLFARQAFMLVRNFLVPNLSVKAGRQLVVWGNHRMMGHFDWNNVGWSHDGLTAELKLDNTATLQVGWLRAAESNCSNATSGDMQRRPQPGDRRCRPDLCPGAHDHRGPGAGAHLDLAQRRDERRETNRGWPAGQSIPAYGRRPGVQEGNGGERGHGRYDRGVLPVRRDRRVE